MLGSRIVAIQRSIMYCALLGLGRPAPVFAVEAPQDVSARATQVQPAESEWPMYNQTYDAQRYSSLKQIDAGNVDGLKEVCRVRVGESGGFPVAPLLIAGVMYLTFRDTTMALNPVDCGVIWKTIYVPEQHEPIAASNRGLAYLGGRLFRGTGDGRLLALDAATGKELWRVAPTDPTAGEWFTAAPIAWAGKVFIGVAGSEFGIKGRMYAFDAGTGKQVWQFNTVPQEHEFGVATWKGDSWKTGGGGTWSTVTLDPDTGELFVPVGNPAPDFLLSYRATQHAIGNNLFTNSIVVLDANTGNLKWWFQATPQDDRDLDQASAPMLFTMGTGRRALAAASKDGYLRVIDRKTHKLIFKLAVTTVHDEDKPVTAEGIIACPGFVGGTQWNGPAYDPSERAIVVGAVDWCTFLTHAATADYTRGKGFYGGNFHSITDPSPSGWVTSVDAATGHVKWKFHAPAPVVSAITPTAGGITFAGDLGGNFYALRSADGHVLFQTVTVGGIAGGIITYTVAQKQYVAITSGNLSRSVWGATGLPHIIIYSVGDAPGLVPTSQPPSGADVGRGQDVYERVCAGCHGAGGAGLSGPTLKGVAARYSPEELSDQVKNPKAPLGSKIPAMPKLYPSVLSVQEVLDVTAYARTL